MAKCWRAACLLTVWHLQAGSVAAFNLDTQNVMERSGDRGSLFGFSVAFHRQLSPTTKNLLLVGAPQSKPPNQANVTGVVYWCDLAAPSERCQPIDFDHGEFHESKGINGQWMGVRVASQGPGKNILACAHRYQQWSPSPSHYVPHLVTGQCYLLGDDLRVGEEERTWRRVVCDSEHLIRRQKDHAWFRYCQQGHGASFAKDNRSLLFGAPGAYLWKGIVRMEVLDNLNISSEEPRETGDIDQLNRTLIPLQRDSYLGFSTDSGMALVRKGELTIVSGAPRGGYSGQVAFMKADPAARRSLSVQLVLSGPGLASSFGYDVAVVDLNGDGWEDLAVGAPQFFVKDGAVGGAVYVYVNDNGQNWEKMDPIRLVGREGSMFGLAVENIGDVNQDGYGDIAVGAPYDGSGQVYIYCGSRGGIHREPAQVLSPGSHAVTLFGYSLSGNLDIDGNQYPDVAVGSLSDSVFVYRARPVVGVGSSLRVTPSEVDIANERCDERTCSFAVQACFSYTAHPPSFNPKLTLNYTFKADAERRRSRLPPRVDFLGSPQGRVELPGQEARICTDIQLQLLCGIQDRLRSIPVSLSVSLWSSSRTPSGSSVDLPDVAPVLNLYQQDSTTSQIAFINKGCGSDGVCQSNLELQYRFCSRRRRDGRDVFESLSREGGVAIVTPSNEGAALEVTVTNRGGDDAHQSRAAIRLPGALHYESAVSGSAPPQETHVTCVANDNGTLIDCELGNPLRRDAEVTFYVILTTSGISLSSRDVSISLQLETTSVQTIQPVQAVAKVFFELDLELYGLAKPSQVSLGKNIKGESAIKSVDEIGAAVEYEFKITNFGRSLESFANVSLSICWPKENSGGKWLLYLTGISGAGVQAVPCSPGSEINPLEHVKGWHGPTRVRREAEHEALSAGGFPFLPQRRKYKTLTCSDGLKCVEMRCPLVGLDSDAAIILHSRLWNATFVEDYSSLNYLDVVVDAELRLTNSPEDIRLVSEKRRSKVRLTVFLDREAGFVSRVAWWIILLTAVAGLLLLAVLGFWLWKRGCNNCPPQKKNDGGPGANARI